VPPGFGYIQGSAHGNSNVSANRTSKAKARKRIASIFTYLQELDRVRTPPVVDLAEYEWAMRLAEVPAAPSIRWGARLAAIAPPGAELADDLVLRVGRPAEAPCPEPPRGLREHLSAGWDQPDRPARLRTVEPTLVAEDSGAFQAVQARRDALDRWLPERDRWAQEQRPMSLYLQLYELWAKFEREAEKYQIYLGDGMLTREARGGDDGRVLHPVVLQRLELHFDPTIPAFTLTESEDAPVLYAPMLRHLEVDGKTLLQLGQRFAEQGLDPLSGADGDQFLQALVHGLWPDGEYVRDRDAPRRAPGPRLYRDPVLYLGHRSHDFAGQIQRYLDALPALPELPTALLRIAGIEPEEGGAAPAKSDPLLTRPANPQQERVIRRLEETGAVLVQGPPGTGKTHTIANLIGHLLAQNKTILVTSHASKALRVLRDQVAEPLRSLCVSVLDSDEDSARQLDESITGILNYFSTTTQDELTGEIAELALARQRLAARCRELAGALDRAAASEVDALEVGGQRVPAAEVVRELLAARGAHDWLPGPVTDMDPPLDAGEVAELYALCARVTPEDERDRELAVPPLDRLPSPEEMAALASARTRAGDAEAQGSRALWRHEGQTDAQLGALADQLAAAARLFHESPPWAFEVLAAAAAGREAAQPWRELAELIREHGRRIPPRQRLVQKHQPYVPDDLPVDEALATCGEILAHLRAGKKLGRTKTMFKPAWQAFMKRCAVDGKPPETVEHFQAIHDLLEIQAARKELIKRWTGQMLPVGAPAVAALGVEPEVGAAPMGEIIERALAWEAQHLRPCEQAMAEAGLDLATVLERSPVPAGRTGRVLQLRAVLGETLPALVEARRRFVRWRDLDARRDAWLAELAGVEEAAPGARAALVAELARAITTGARDTYARAHARAERLAGLAPAIARRDELLARLEPYAPAWARALRERQAPHAAGVPGAKDPDAAWSYRRWAQALAAATTADLDALQAELELATAELHELTARYVEKLAWHAQFGRTGLEQQQALAGWLALHKKIGKGSGKNAARLKEEAKRTLIKCRQAVPVWIMPLSRVMESFDLATTRFDVIILDEASQCDILGLPCFAMAREVAVVGDHEQVSPYAVGHETDKIQALIDELLEDVPNKQLYDGRTSVYDLARQSFGGTIRLLEHFRCVPEIIEFSNQLCYAGEIRALREASSARVKPALVAHHVPRGEKIDKVNEEEASEIAALVTAVCEAPEYEGCSIGVISMVGTEQAVVIDAMLRRHLPASEYRRRRLLCGNASQFQGDERDVVFLSMVDSSADAGKRLAVQRRDEARKVFNVAASRARDQLWVVHSLDPDRDLKDGDLRLALLSHAKKRAAGAGAAADDDAGGAGARPGSKRAPSAFERDLAEALRARGYRPHLRWPIGNYVVDIAVEGAGGHRLAIQCDGARGAESATERAAAVERQLTLERLGWRFVRVRASRFALAPDETALRVCARLRELGVLPLAPLASAPASPAQEPPDALVRRILARAAQLRGGSRPTLRAVSNSE
jgi:very-short-patch-repair endonuclease/DNA polymerase III delta prime subunit